MGSELCANGLVTEGTISSNFIPICVIPKVDSPIVEEKSVRRFPQSSDLIFDQRPSCIGRPVTPDLDRASAEQSLDMPSQGQSMLFSSPSSNGTETPKDSIFDPFAPVYDKLVLAPPRNKCMEESRNNIVRRLDFSSSTNLVTNSDQDAYNEAISVEEQLLAIVYSDLLDFITLERTKEFGSESLSQVSDSGGFSTPKFAARLSGIAETCPGAPKKSISKYRNIDKNLCRKLEY